MRQQRNQSFRRTNAVLEKMDQSKKISLLKTLPFKLSHRQPPINNHYFPAHQKLPIEPKLPPIKLLSESRCSTSISGDQKSLQGIQIGLLKMQRHQQQFNYPNNPQIRDIFSLLQSTRSKLHPYKVSQKAKTSLTENGHPLRILARRTMRTVVIIQQDDFSRRKVKKPSETKVARSFTLALQGSSPQRDLSPLRKYSISGWDTFQQSE